MATHSKYSCLENSIDRQRNLASYRPWGHKESDTTENVHKKIFCCGLNGISPKGICYNTHSQCDGIWRRNLRETLRVEAS